MWKWSLNVGYIAGNASFLPWRILEEGGGILHIFLYSWPWWKLKVPVHRIPLLRSSSLIAYPTRNKETLVFHADFAWRHHFLYLVCRFCWKPAHSGPPFQSPSMKAQTQIPKVWARYLQEDWPCWATLSRLLQTVNLYLQSQKLRTKMAYVITFGCVKLIFLQ